MIAVFSPNLWHTSQKIKHVPFCHKYPMFLLTFHGSLYLPFSFFSFVHVFIYRYVYFICTQNVLIILNQSLIFSTKWFFENQLRSINLTSLIMPLWNNFIHVIIYFSLQSEKNILYTLNCIRTISLVSILLQNWQRTRNVFRISDFKYNGFS